MKDKQLNKKIVEKQRNWYFTFGSDQPHDGCYIKFFGTREETREKMFNSFGQKWSTQYSEEKWHNPTNDSIRFNGLNPKDRPNMAQVWSWKEIT